MQNHSFKNSNVFSQHFTNPNCVNGLSNAAYMLLQELDPAFSLNQAKHDCGPGRASSASLSPAKHNCGPGGDSSASLSPAKHDCGPQRASSGSLSPAKHNCGPGGDSQRDLVYVCIGTDRATGDCLGPLVGNKLRLLLPSAHVFGTLEQPLHALNLEDTLKSIYLSYSHPLLIAIDAGLGQPDRVGFLTMRRGSVCPGLALRKQLPAVGDIHIVGTVNVSGFSEHLILQNTRLFIVYKMAEAIARALFLAHHRHCISKRDGDWSKPISVEPQ